MDPRALPGFLLDHAGIEERRGNHVLHFGKRNQRHGIGSPRSLCKIVSQAEVIGVSEISRNLFAYSSVHTAMKTNYALALTALAVLFPLTGLAQDPDHSWFRAYPVTGKPTLTLETSDAGVEFHPCGDCHEIRIHIEVVGRKLSDYRLEEGQ